MAESCGSRMGRWDEDVYTIDIYFACHPEVSCLSVGTFHITHPTTWHPAQSMCPCFLSCMMFMTSSTIVCLSPRIAHSNRGLFIWALSLFSPCCCSFSIRVQVVRTTCKARCTHLQIFVFVAKLLRRLPGLSVFTSLIFLFRLLILHVSCKAMKATCTAILAFNEFTGDLGADGTSIGCRYNGDDE